LSQNYPNPFNPATTIVYSLAKTSRVRLTIYSIKGDEIITLVDKRQPHGEYWIDWNGKDSLGRPVASEIYFYRLSTESYVKTRKMLFVR
jgi:flagellar hook assembly protein FlgD